MRWFNYIQLIGFAIAGVMTVRAMYAGNVADAGPYGILTGTLFRGVADTLLRSDGGK